jgi:hypothetical protein
MLSRASLFGWTLAGLATVLCCRWLQAETVYHVATHGSDANAGTEEAPFATLDRAQQAVRTLREAGPWPEGGVVVWLRGGDYVRTQTLEFTADNSGTPTAPVVWKAWPSETVRLLGGRTLTGSQPVQDAAVLARLDSAAREHVRQIDLRAAGISTGELGALASRGFGRPLTPAHAELFFAGRPLTLARWPNEGHWETIAGFPETHAQDDGHGGKIGRLEDGFAFATDRPARWHNTDDIWVHGYWSWDWANSYERVSDLNVEQRSLKTAPPHGLYGFRRGQRFYFLNVLEELDQPGEWYLDRANGVLYVWLPPATTGTDEVLLSLFEGPLVRFSDASHIALDGLVLEATRGTAVVVQGGTGNRVRRCTIRNIGNWGVRVEGGTDHAVERCEIVDTGDGGVSLQGGDRQTLTPGGHCVENCHFARQGRWSKCYVPAVMMSGVGLRAAHNHIHDHPHCAILYGGNEHLIEFNEIHHIALETGDVGAIYSGRDWTFRGNRIRHNLIHHTGGVGMGSMGVYMDDCVSGTEVFGNIFYQVHWAMFIGGGRDHRVENNLFVECDPAIRVDGRGLDKSPVWFNMVYEFMKKQLAAVPRELYRARYPALTQLDRYYATTDGVPPENNVVARNVCVGKWLEVVWHANPEWLRLEDNFTEGDPQLADPEQLDFRIAPDSPVWATGFRPIPQEKIGIQPDKE